MNSQTGIYSPVNEFLGSGKIYEIEVLLTPTEDPVTHERRPLDEEIIKSTMDVLQARIESLRIRNVVIVLQRRVTYRQTRPYMV